VPLCGRMQGVSIEALNAIGIGGLTALVVPLHPGEPTKLPRCHLTRRGVLASLLELRRRKMRVFVYF